MIDQATETGDERLRRVLAVTDSGLSRLATDDLFRELLERVCALIGVDTAVIMLIDQDAQQLVTVASLGLDDEVRQGFRLDVGAGFAGRVAATRTTVIVNEVNETTVASPILRDRGISSLIGVPMLAGGELMGVLHVGTVAPRHFTEQDVGLLQLVADRAALAGQAHQSRADRDATLALQRSLLPTRLPNVEGVDLAARYLPGHNLGVGGDWYDVFQLPSGYLGVVVGDVSGHGLRAAVVMGRLRSALRAYALDWDDPADVLTRLDRKIRHFEAGNLATLLYAIISPDRRHITISTAGHLPPVLGLPHEPSRLLSVPVDVPVGVGHTRIRQSTVVDFPVGSVILFYTDGLVERRTEIIDEGLRRLCDVVRPDAAEAVCATVMAAMDVGDAEDDIAVLAVRRLH